MSNPRGARGRGSIHPASPQELHVDRGSADSTWKGGRPLELLEASLAVHFVSHPLRVGGVCR